MGITAKMKERRKKRLGASDVPVALGFGRPDSTGEQYKSPRALWAEKTKSLIATGDPPGLPAQLGLSIEQAIIKIAARRFGIKGRSNVYRVHQPDGILCANLDYLWASGKKAFEVKLVTTKDSADRWGAPPDEIPDAEAVQGLAQMAVADLVEVIYPVAFLGYSTRLEFYRLKRNEKTIHLLIEKALAWWQLHIVNGFEPLEGGSRDIELFKKVKGVPGKVGNPVPANLVDQYLEMDQLIKQWSKTRDKVQADLISIMGPEAESAVVGEDEFAHPKLFTYKRQTAARFDLARFRQDHPKLYAQYATISSYPVARLVKNRNYKALTPGETTDVRKYTADKC